MQNRTGKIGYYREESVSKYFLCICIVFSLTFPNFIYCQSSNSLSLHEALLELAKDEKVAIAFSTYNIPQKTVVPLPDSKSLKEKLSFLLSNTDLFFEIRSNQIFLYKKHKIYGYIEDIESGEKLIGSTIYLPKSGDYEVEMKKWR